jgi:K+-transporting ATPase ATPase C chain
MKQNILPAIRLTIVSIVIFCGIYSLLILGIAQFAPGKGEGETVIINGQVKGYALEGQSFTQDKYFNGRPSAAGYNAASSAASNKGPTNPDYLKGVQVLVDSFLVHNPSVTKGNIPSELVTASGSGLDPDVSPEGAMVQVARVAKARNLPEATIRTLVTQQIQKPLLGLLGTERVNVLQLNIALDQLK